MKFDSMGRELPDPRPIELAPGAIRPESLQSMMQRMIREHLSQAAVDNGDESFEEANDFEVDDEDFEEPLTKYEEMGLEPISAAETEDGPAPSGDTGSAEPAGLRTAGARAPAGARGLQEGDVDSESSVGEDSPVPAPAREASLEPRPNGAPVHGRAKRP